MRYLFEAAMTPDELDELLLSHGMLDQWPTQKQGHAFARAVLAKWGTLRAEKIVIPTDTMEQEFQKHYRLGYEAGKKATTPQPTQAQAGAVPLTCEWTHDENDGFWESACGEAWQFNDGGPADNNVRFCQGCGKPLGIKGGQHGTE